MCACMYVCMYVCVCVYIYKIHALTKPVDVRVRALKRELDKSI